MGRQRTTTPSADLTTLRTRIEAWRQVKRGGEAMPEPLWQEAAALACLHGITPTSRALKLHYNELKRRALAEPAPPHTDANLTSPLLHHNPSPFIELTNALFPAPTLNPTPTVLELTSGAHTLKLTCGASHTAELGALVRAFLEAAP